MKIFIVNFEQIIKNYTPYQNSSKEIENEKNKFTNRVQEIKNEMETIVNSSRLLVLDQSLKEQNGLKLRELQAEGMKLESEFRYMISQKQNEILEKNFSEISDIVKKWATDNKADIVLNNNSIVFSKESLDVTDKIVDILKKENLYSEWIESENYAEVSQELN
jgi:Skp family chaperone for outer membrane proteins